MVSWRAHEESRTKGRRVAAAWAEKRRKVTAGEAARLTTKGPSWLVADGEGWREEPVRADTVRRIFALTLAGEGEHRIAKLFNAERVPMLEREAISARTKAALAAAKARGAQLGNPNGAAALRRAGKGNAASVQAQKAAADQLAERLASTVADLRSEGLTSLPAIAGGLNARHIRTARGGSWHPSSVRNLLARLGAA